MKTLKIVMMAALGLTQFTSVYGAPGQACNANMVESAPASNFTLNANGTAVDNNTNLMWKRCVEDRTWNDATSHCDGSLTAVGTWQEALTAANDSVFAGHTDWRLPNVKELYSIIETSCSGPALNTDVFSVLNTSDVWTSTFLAKDDDSAYMLSAYYGTVQSPAQLEKDTTGYFRLVRDN